MARLYLVRHGKAAASYAEHIDPGLDRQGMAEAAAAAERLAPLGPLAIISSPLKRAQETAAPLAARWRAMPRIEAAVSEIPSPGLGLAERAEWLRGLMAGTWRGLGPDLARWREGVIAALHALPADTVVFSHFIAINVAVGAATGDDRLVVFRPANGSVTILEGDAGTLRLVALGTEADTKVN